MCAVVGLWSPGTTAAPLLEALLALQHRGQEGAGVLLGQHAHSERHTGSGPLAQALPLERLAPQLINKGLGHLRYSTSGSSGSEALQPLYGQQGAPVALVHNGNLTNIPALCEQVAHPGPFVSDTDLLTQLLAEQLVVEGGSQALLASAQALLGEVQGGFSCIAWLPGQLLAFRDPMGIRPLQLGRRDSDSGTEWLLASETKAFEAAGFEFVRDLVPGEILLIDAQGALHSRILPGAKGLCPSAFEYVYFADADSTLDGISVLALRQELGRRIAAQLQANNADLEGALVVPVPSTSCPAARTLADSLQLPYWPVLEKRADSGRSFIHASPARRKAIVREKFTLKDDALAGKHLLLVDDSIVRGTTLSYLVSLLLQAGAARITLCSTAPPVRYCDCYGIDLSEPEELVAYDRSEAEIADYLQVDQLFYLPQEQLLSALRQQNPVIEHFECALFDGNYVAGFQNRAQASRLLSAPIRSRSLPQAIPA